jgi:hypothetical protein
MIKRYNESWEDSGIQKKNISRSFEEFLDANEPVDTIKVLPTDSWYDAYKKAKNLAVLKNKKIVYDYNNITHIITPKTSREDLYNEYSKNSNKPERNGIIIGGDEEDIKPKETHFDTKSYDVVGLPSGQMLYMNNKQIKYFKARNIVTFTKIWKRPIKGGGISIVKLNKYTFEDPNYDKIMNSMETILWD